jgi:hypothetical protein
VRLALRPIFEQLYETEAQAALATGLRSAYAIKETEQRRSLIVPRQTKVMQTVATLLTCQLELAAILGTDSPLVSKLGAVAKALSEYADASADWLDGETSDDEMRARADSLGNQYATAIGEFTRAAYDGAGWETAGT